MWSLLQSYPPTDNSASFNNHHRTKSCILVLWLLGFKREQTKFGSSQPKILYHFYAHIRGRNLVFYFLSTFPIAPYTRLGTQQMINKCVLTKIRKTRPKAPLLPCFHKRFLLAPMSWPHGSLKLNYNELFYKNVSF